VRTIIFNGLNFDDSFGFILTRQSHVYAPSQRVPFSEAAWVDGGYVNDRYAGGRTIGIQGIVRPEDSVALTEAKLDGLMQALNRQRAPVPLVLTVHSDHRYWLAVLAGEVGVSWVGGTPALSWSMFAPDPKSFHPTVNLEDWVTGASPDSHNMPEIEGSADSMPVVVINPAASDAMSAGVTVENTLTGDLVSISDPGNQGSPTRNIRLRFDSGRRTVERSTDSGVNWFSIDGLITDFSSFPRLAPGADVTNVIKITGLASGADVSATWQSRFA
jgi:hypothetical protein